ncbi:hypothetical protein IJM86_03380 [bacterium]|nr:hypothetical protein [bacterium]
MEDLFVIHQIHSFLPPQQTPYYLYYHEKEDLLQYSQTFLFLFLVVFG